MPYTNVVKEGEIIHVSFRINSWPYNVTLNVWNEDRIELAETLVKIASALRRKKDSTEPHMVTHGDD